MKVCRKEGDRREEEQTEKDRKGPGNFCNLIHIMNSSQTMELCRYFTYIHLLGAEPHDRITWSVFFLSHQLMNHAENIPRTEFWVSCWVFWSRTLTQHAWRGRKQSGEISVSQIWQSCFPEDIRWADWEWKMWVRGHNDFSFPLKQTVFIWHIYIHIYAEQSPWTLLLKKKYFVLESTLLFGGTLHLSCRVLQKVNLM